SGISDISDSLRSAVSTRVRTGVSSSSAILVTRELFSLLSILVRISEMFMTAGLPKRGGGEEKSCSWTMRRATEAIRLGKCTSSTPKWAKQFRRNGPNGSEEKD